MDSKTSSNNVLSNYRSWAERNGFTDWALALLWIIAAFFLFQFVANLVGLALIVMQEGISEDPAEMMVILTDNLDLLFIGNSTGQILFLGLGTWIFARLHSPKQYRAKFFRFSFHSDTTRKIIATIVLVIAIQPVIWFLSWINSFVPVPEAFSELQSSQMEMIENYLRGDHMILLTLFHVALVPAICEEMLYRGYVMRAFQRSWGIWPAIIISGLLFGLYHVQLSNLLPLAALGILFAYVTWISESIYPAIIAHLVNNGGSVLVGAYYPESAFAEITPETMPPLFGVILSLIISSYIVYWMYKNHTKSPAPRR